MPRVSVQPEVFQKLPGMKILLIPILDLQKIDEAKCAELLESSWCHTRDELKGLPKITDHPHIQAWRTAYTSLGISVKKFTASIENLCKRAVKEGSQPRHINAFVDFYNSVSLQFLVPFGAMDLDSEGGLLKNMELRFSKEGDTFCALDAEESEKVPAGEVCYAAEDGVIVTRHINWRQSKYGLIQNNTKNILLMAELLEAVSDQSLEAMKVYLQEKCLEIFDKKVTCHLVDRKNPVFEY